MLAKTQENECACGEEISHGRVALGYTTCLWCGEIDAKNVRKGWCVAPMHKSNYILITRGEDLIGLNNKGGLVR